MPLPKALAHLFALKAWMIWRREERDGKPTKVPYQSKYPNRHASTSSPSTWSSYKDAAAAMPHLSSRGGVGFNLSGNNVIGFDLDKCIDNEGRIAAWAWEIIQRCGSYTEISPSGRGVRIFGLSKNGAESFTLVQQMPGGARLEVYRNCKRYLTVTGHNHFDSLDRLQVLDDVLTELEAQHTKKKGEGGAEKKSGSTAGPADSSTSGVFHKKVCKLFDNGLEPDEVVDKIKRQPKRWEDTKAGVYEKERRLNKEVKRCFDKWRESKGAQLEVKWSSGRLPMKTLVADAKIAIEALGIECRLNRFRLVILIEGEAMKWSSGPATDDGLVWLRSLIWQRFKFDPGKDNTYEAMHQLALENAFDPIREYLMEQREKWDGESRNLAVDYLGCEDNELNRAIGELAMVAAVRRALHPGTKFDQIIVLEGEEGTNKSTAIQVLAGEEYFSDQSILTVKDEKQQEALRGRWLYEIADLKGINHAEVEAVKAFASRQFDRGRKAWGRVVEDQPRRCVLFASTNDKNYLKGDTGNRRWWPLPCGKIMINWLRRDRDQLWAEAAVLEAAGKELVLPRHLWEQAKKAQDDRLEQHPWMEILRLERGVKHQITPSADFPEGGTEERISSEYLLTDVLKIEIARQRVGDAKQVAALMRRLGWDGPKPLRVQRGSEPVKGYSRTQVAKVIDLDEARRNKGKED